MEDGKRHRLWAESMNQQIKVRPSFMNKLNAHGPQRSLRLLLPLLLLGALGLATHAADKPPFKFLRLTTGDVTDRPALNSVMEKWVPFLKEHFPASHVSEFQTSDSGKAAFVDFASDLSDFERHDKEFQSELAKYQELKLPNLGPLWERSFAAMETSVWENQPELSYAPTRGDS